MEAAKIAATYEEIGQMEVHLPKNPQLGMAFYKELLASCREYQDRVGDLTIAVYRDYARVKIQTRALKKSIQLAGATEAMPIRDQLLALEDESDGLRYLLESLRVKKANLFGAANDIRLTVTIIEDQIKLGEVKKPSETTASAEKTDFRPPLDARLGKAETEPAPAVEEGRAEPPPPANVNPLKPKKTTRPAKVAEVVASAPEAATQPLATPATPAGVTVVEEVEDLDAFLELEQP